MTKTYASNISSSLANVCSAAIRNQDDEVLEYLTYERGDLPEGAIAELLSYRLQYVYETLV